MGDSIFTKIINGDIPSYKIAENENFIAFLDLMPLREGHTLVVPKHEIDYIYDLPDQLLADLMIFSKYVSKKIESKIKCKRIGVAVIGLEVPHAHVHLIPINTVSDMNFNKDKLKFTNEEFKSVADLINETD
jgi:histidine triad (HIT) family protein